MYPAPVGSEDFYMHQLINTNKCFSFFFSQNHILIKFTLLSIEYVFLISGHKQNIYKECKQLHSTVELKNTCMCVYSLHQNLVVRVELVW